MPYIPIENANGDTVNISTTQVTRDGNLENLELITIADPLSANQASVSAPGTTGLFGIAVQGMTSGVPLPVVTSVQGSTNSTITSVTITTTSATLLSASSSQAPNRLGLIIFNVGPSIVYVSYGSTNDAVSNFSFSIAPGAQQYVDTIPWRGAITAITSQGTAQVQCTELS